MIALFIPRLIQPLQKTAPLLFIVFRLGVDRRFIPAQLHGLAGMMNRIDRHAKSRGQFLEHQIGLLLHGLAQRRAVELVAPPDTTRSKRNPRLSFYSRFYT